MGGAVSRSSEVPLHPTPTLTRRSLSSTSPCTRASPLQGPDVPGSVPWPRDSFPRASSDLGVPCLSAPVETASPYVLASPSVEHGRLCPILRTPVLRPSCPRPRSGPSPTLPAPPHPQPYLSYVPLGPALPSWVPLAPAAPSSSRLCQRLSWRGLDRYSGRPGLAPAP